jgi:hypothetical protein
VVVAIRSRDGALPPETLEALCQQLPLPLLVQLVNYAQTLNQTEAAQETREDTAAEKVATPTGATAPPSTNGDNGSEQGPRTESLPSINGDNGEPEPAPRAKRPSTNGKARHGPRLAGFDWLRELRRILP